MSHKRRGRGEGRGEGRSFGDFSPHTPHTLRTCGSGWSLTVPPPTLEESERQEEERGERYEPLNFLIIHDSLHTSWLSR